MKWKKFRIIFSCITAVFIVAVLMLNILFPIKHSRHVNSAAREFDVGEKLIYAVIWTESKFDKKAKSGAGAKGLMQIMPKTAMFCAAELGIEYDEDKLFTPKYNIRLGTFYLKYLIEKYGERDALVAYNAGEGRLSEWQGEIKFQETRDYIKRVQFAKKIYDIKL